MQLVTPDHSILHHVCRSDFTISLDDINQMFFLMREKNGLGLAASQVGIDARLFITHWGQVFVNPEIVGTREAYFPTEGCLTLPNAFVRKRRYYEITLADGQTFRGPEAHIIQHEIDHLNGVLLTDEFQPVGRVQ